MRILGTHHVAIVTSHFDRLRAFYEDTLGLPVVGGFPGHDILFFGAGSTTIEIIGEPVPAEPAKRRGWHHLAWEVDDVDAAYAELIALGVRSHSSPEDFPSEAPTLRIAFLEDPDGNLLELVQPLAARYPVIDAPPQTSD